MAKGNKQSVSGTDTLPHYAHRRRATDFRGSLEYAVVEKWAKMNVRDPVINRGEVPVDSLVPKVRRVDGTKVLDPTALAAINTTMQWLFGTNGGRACAQELLALEKEVYVRRQKEIEKIPMHRRTMSDIM